MAINDSQAKKTAEDILRIVLRNESDSIEAMTSLATLLQASNRSDGSVHHFKPRILFD